jgi:hypothetical protein
VQADLEIKHWLVPHMRGWSGLFPRPSNRARGYLRECGAGPRYCSISVTVPPSSPHTGGGSQPGHGQAGDAAVDTPRGWSGRMGTNLLAGPWSPRPRGGPYAKMWKEKDPRSSRTRGVVRPSPSCGRPARRRPRTRGVVRRSPIPSVRCTCRPRTRGGGPRCGINSMPMPTSSRHTRGWSDGQQQDRRHHEVVPAHAGVILDPDLYRHLLRVVPARAGVIRRWFAAARPDRNAPADAGVIRGCRTRQRRPRVPRTGGGDPNDAIRKAAPEMVPRTRGGDPAWEMTSAQDYVCVPRTRGAPRRP